MVIWTNQLWKNLTKVKSTNRNGSTSKAEEKRHLQNDSNKFF
jgi:hypothetical protein